MSPRSPQTHPIDRPHFPPTLPPGVIRLDEQDAADDIMPPHPFAEAGPTGAIPARHHRSVTRDDPHATRIISRPIRRTSGPATGSLDIDADLFTPAAERLARQTPSGGIAARHTPSAGLSLAHLPSAVAGGSVGAPTTPAGAYPRRRDLRRQGGVAVTGPIPLPPTAPPGLAFLPAQSPPAPCSGEIPLGTALPRRRDLRTGAVPAAEPVESGERAPAEQRTGAIAVGVARAAVMTMLVGVGYAVVSSHQLSLDSATDGVSASGGSPEAMLAAGGDAGQARVSESEWDVRGEVAQAKTAADKQTQARLVVARAAAERVRVAKAAAAARAAQLAQATRDAQRNPKALAKMLAAQRGWGSTQFTCLDLLWTRESGWNYRASNPSSGAYGIPQSLPGSKMGSVASDWRTNPATQIKWGLEYIADRYGTPCGAWAHSESTGWY